MPMIEWDAVPELTSSRSRVVKATLANGDYTESLKIGHEPDNTIHFTGPFGVGGSVTLYGSNNEADIDTDPAVGTWVALQDNLGNAITKTSTKSGDVIIEGYALIAAKVTAGDVDTAIVARLKLTGGV